MHTIKQLLYCVLLTVLWVVYKKHYITCAELYVIIISSLLHALNQTITVMCTVNCTVGRVQEALYYLCRTQLNDNCVKKTNSSVSRATLCNILSCMIMSTTVAGQYMYHILINSELCSVYLVTIL
jgi:hypothetical protein